MRSFAKTSETQSTSPYGNTFFLPQTTTAHLYNAQLFMITSVSRGRL